MPGAVTLLLGGARSGKSALAVEIGRRHPGPVTVIATGEAFDDEMAARIDRHRAERPAWPTVEAPCRLADAVAGAPADDLLIVDCLTLWVNNLHLAGEAVDPAPLVEALSSRPGPSVVVSNEVGLGIVPADPATRRYRDELGALNRAVAEIATVLFLAAGRAVRLEDPWALI